MNDASPRAVAVLDGYGVSHKAFFGNRRLRLRETVLEEGDRLHVLGDVVTGRDGRAIGKGPNDLFVIGEGDENEMLRRLGKKARGFLFVACGTLAFGGGLVALLL